MNKWMWLCSVLLVTGCTGKDQGSSVEKRQDARPLNEAVELAVNMTVHNYAPAPLKGVDVQLFLPMDKPGFQSVALLDDTGTLNRVADSPAVLALPVGDMSARASFERSAIVRIGYNGDNLPLNEFEPVTFPVTAKASPGVANGSQENELVEPEQPAMSDLVRMHSTGQEDIPLETPRPDLSEADQKWLSDLIALNDKGVKVYAFEGIVCERKVPCRLSEKSVWFVTESDRGVKSDKSAPVRLVYQNLTSLEQVRQALINKHQLVLSSAAVELK